jgi:hypothetical protein
VWCARGCWGGGTHVFTFSGLIVFFFWRLASERCLGGSHGADMRVNEARVLSRAHTNTHTHTHSLTHARTHARARARTHTPSGKRRGGAQGARLEEVAGAPQHTSSRLERELSLSSLSFCAGRWCGYGEYEQEGRFHVFPLRTRRLTFILAGWRLRREKGKS